MSTSGNTSYESTTTQLITNAFQLLEIYGSSETVSGEDYSSALVVLNGMIKHLQAANNFYMHQVEGATLFLAVGQNTYQIGNSSSDKIGLQTNVVETQLTEAEIIADTLMHVNSTTGMLAGDTVGVVQDNSVIKWTTIATVNSSVTLTLTAALDVAAASGAYVFSYRTAAGRPLELRSTMLRQSGGTDTTLSQIVTEIPMSAIGREQYFRYPQKGRQGTPLQYYLEKRNKSSTIHLFPTPSTPNYRIVFQYDRIIENFTNSSDNPDLPQEYFECLYYNLAVRLAPRYNRMDRLQYLEQKAQLLLDEACSVSQENNVSLIIRPK